MANVIQPIEHRYELTKKLKTTFHYQQTKVSGGKAVLTSTIKITENRGFNNSTHPFLMYERDNPKRWNKRISTGLERTKNRRVYIGDLTDQYNRKKDKVKFEFNGDQLIITVYPDYFRL